ncbi:DUF1016 domain-containing protein [Odoribacter sp. OttesenSCG-928-J03]|nr:DUF1016 domain-containing protein [Odoribacter sp. OttesenSCG-928-J03]MDL2282935.1 DUF1016 domain-containing protein [Odoribacter sp. OttesenSCG-928-G04]
MTKDPYNFDFLAITENYKEKELKDALIQNITKFLLELGTNVLAQYSLEASSQPIGVSEYELIKLYPTNFKGTLPSIEDIENELRDDLNS